MDKRQTLINHCAKNGRITTKEANELLKDCYYCNSGHHIQEILSRLVKARIFKRVERGVYEIGSTPIEVNVPKNQTNLF